ncbi:MAG TPA: T9SS type B sorting domain-containing protein, partial [Flavobacteriales bacterium]
ERFGVVGRYIELYRLRIFDRWGSLLFETVDPMEGWDGTIAGTAATPGVYVYQVRYKGPTTEAVERLGHVTLLR